MINETLNQPIELNSLPKRQVYITFAGVMLAILLGSLDQTIVGTAMPRIISDLGGFTHYTWITIAYMIASTIVVPITGKLTDMFGRKPLYIIGLSIFIIGSLLSGLSQTMLQIVIFRGFQGLGAGIMMVNAFIVTGDFFAPSERGKYQGYVTGVFGLSSIIGPTLGGFITDALSWHWIFFINIPLGILIFILFIIFFPNIRPNVINNKIDYWGIITLILTIVPAMLALSWGGIDFPWISLPIISMFVFSIIMGITFVFIERRSDNPIIPLSLFRNRIVAVSEMVTFFTAIGMFGSIIFVPLFFQGVLGMSPTKSGSFLTPMLMGMVTGSLISGQLLSRTGGHYKIQGAIGIGIMLTGMIFLSTMSIDTSYSEAVLNIILTGFGLGITMPLYTISVQNAVPYKSLGVATSSIPFFRSIGGSVGLAIYGSILNNRFARGFINLLPSDLINAVPQEQLNNLARNPQALVSIEAQTQLKAMLENFGSQGAAFFEHIMHALNLALDSALSEVFLIGAIVVAVSFVINLFIKEIPLRKQNI